MKNPNVLFVFRRNRAQMIADYQAGTGPDDMLYGFNRIPRNRYDLDFIEGNEFKPTLGRLTWKPIEHWLASRVGMGFTQPLVHEHSVAINRADVIVATVDACALPLLRWRAKGRLRAPVIAISQGLADRIGVIDQQGVVDRRIAELYRRYYQAADWVVVLGQGAVVPTQEVLGLSPDKITHIPFGIDESFWSPGLAAQNTSGGAYVLCVGSDPGRDYKTLLRAMRGLNILVKIVTRLPVESSSLIEVGSNYSDVELRSLYQSARFVVTPLRDVSQPSGQSATLQAMACGKPVILTRTRGLWDTAMMRDGDSCLLVNPGDAAGLGRAIENLWNDPAQVQRLGTRARGAVLSHAKSSDFAAKMLSLIDEVFQMSNAAKNEATPSVLTV